MENVFTTVEIYTLVDGKAVEGMDMEITFIGKVTDM